MHRGTWEKRLMKFPAPLTSFKSVRNLSNVARLSSLEKFEGNGFPMAVSI